MVYNHDLIAFSAMDMAELYCWRCVLLGADLQGAEDAQSVLEQHPPSLRAQQAIINHALHATTA